MLRIGVLCPAEIAYRRFLPALETIPDISYVGVGINNPEERYGRELPSIDEIRKMLANSKQKADKFVESFGGIIFNSYMDVVTSDLVDAVYIPLPPALHYKWAKLALKAGKHVLVEKPATTTLLETIDLVNTASSRNLALHENYMFAFHKQLSTIQNIILNGELGDIRLYRVDFGFPMRSAQDFRYDKNLGGGSLLDAGGYTIKYSSMLLGENAKIAYAQLNGMDGFGVDMFGSGALVNDDGVTAQFAFGMDNEYKCDLEIWGSKGRMISSRVLTAPAGFSPMAKIIKSGKEETITLPSDDSFRMSIMHFMHCIESENMRHDNYIAITTQANLIESFIQLTRQQI